MIIHSSHINLVAYVFKHYFKQNKVLPFLCHPTFASSCVWRKQWMGKTPNMTSKISNLGNWLKRVMVHKLWLWSRRVVFLGSLPKVSFILCWISRFLFYLDLCGFISFWKGRNSIFWSPSFVLRSGSLKDVQATYEGSINLQLDHCS